MTTAEILVIMRQFIGEAAAVLDGEIEFYSDADLLGHTKTADFLLKAAGVVTAVTIDTDAETITPDPVDAIGLLLAYKGSIILLRGDLTKRVRLGELGVSFRSGATSITTTEATRSLNTGANNLATAFENLLTLYLSDDPNKVLTRLL